MAQAGIGNIVRREEALVDAGAADKLTQAGLLSIITSSMAVSLAVRDPPPPGISTNAYYLALTGAFFGGTVFARNNIPRVRRVAGRKQLMCAAVGSLALVLGLSVASLLW